jgi:hypothetical protein
MEDAPETISVFSNADIAVLRSGKAKKNDPPIPADLAPISGSGKRVRKPREEEEKILLEPIRFRYSTEAVVEEPAEEEITGAAPETAEEPRNSRSRRRRKPHSSGPKEPREEQAPKVEKQEKPKKEQPKEPKAEPQAEGEQAKKNPRRRPNHRRRRGPKPTGETE